MPYTAAHQLISFIGSSYNGAEHWQFGLRVLGSVPPSTGQMDGLVAAGSTLMAAAGAKISSYAKLEVVKVAPQSVDGLYPEDLDATERILPTPVTGSSSGNTYPQISMCVSLTTARTRGLAHRGRYYPPLWNGTTDTDGRASIATITAAVTAHQAFINAVNNVNLGDVVVMSKIGAGRTELVTGIEIGRVADTQRRRRSSLAEGYIAAAIT